MTSLNRHGAKEAYKHLRMKKNGLTTIKVAVTRKFGRLKVDFAGSDAEVKKALQILADWA
jgi:N-methylhydantoinase B/oxoprolinase/acetone carboxylase alpha subunit